VRNDVNILAVTRNLFPIARTETSFNLLNVPYVNLASMPAFCLPMPPAKREWLASFLAWSFPDKQNMQQSEAFGIATSIKQSVSSLILKSSESINVFGISNPDPKIGLYTLIFVNELRLDLSSRSVVVDACVVPLTKYNTQKVMATMQIDGLSTISLVEDDGRAWKAVLPVFAERCRTWKHNDQCEYRKCGIPACGEGAWDFAASPLCSCGLGQDLGAFAELPDWKPIHSEATRIAISPFFPFSFLGKGGRTSGAASSGPVSNDDVCAHCSGPGLPKLLVCGRCKQIKYCSQACQKTHWKTHKLLCSK